MNFVIDGNLSFNSVQLKSFQELLETVSGRKIVIPTRHKFMQTLDSEYAKTKEALIKTLSQQENLCITADAWSSRAQSYLGVTVHFINNDFIRESYALGFKQLDGKQTYKVLATALDSIFGEYCIRKSQITNIVTDGGSNFCKMFKIYGKSIDAVVTIDGEEVAGNAEGDENNYDEDIEENTTTLFMTDVHGEPFMNEILGFVF